MGPYSRANAHKIDDFISESVNKPGLKSPHIRIADWYAVTYMFLHQYNVELLVVIEKGTAQETFFHSLFVKAPEWDCVRFRTAVKERAELFNVLFRRQGHVESI